MIELAENDEWQKWRDAWRTSTKESPQDEESAEDTHKDESDSVAVAVDDQKQAPKDDPLEHARKWVGSQGKQNLKDILKRLFQEQTAAARSTTDHKTTRSGETAKCLLRQIEWHVVLLVELWIHDGYSMVELAYPKLVALQASRKSRSSKKKKKQRKNQTPSSAPRAPPATHEQKQTAMLEHLTSILSRAAFYLPANDTFGAFLTRRCFTKLAWRKIPNVVTYVLNDFELANPFLPKEEDEDDRIMLVKKKKKKVKKAVTAALAKPRPRLVAQKRNRFGGSHFHRSNSLLNISKLLDDGLSTPATKSNCSSSSIKSKLTKTSSSLSNLVTPHTTVTASKRNVSEISKRESTAATIAASSRGNDTHNKMTNNGTDLKSNFTASNRIRKEQNKKRPREQTLQDSVMTTPISNKQKRSISFERIVAAETPIPNATHKMVVGETPSNNYTALARISSVVGETPTPRARTQTVVGETPCRKVIAETPTVPPPKMALSPLAAVQPLNLFATRKPRQSQTNKKAESTSTEKATKSNRMRPISAVLSAARAYLRRNSLD
jgi:hypothetical protein